MYCSHFLGRYLDPSFGVAGEVGGEGRGAAPPRTPSAWRGVSRVCSFVCICSYVREWLPCTGHWLSGERGMTQAYIRSGIGYLYIHYLSTKLLLISRTKLLKGISCYNITYIQKIIISFTQTNTHARTDGRTHTPPVRPHTPRPMPGSQCTERPGAADGEAASFMLPEVSCASVFAVSFEG